MSDNNVNSIIREWLDTHSFDGLYSPNECACLKDDLFPCGDGPYAECCAGYKRTDEPDESVSDKEWHTGDWWVSGAKRKVRCDD